MFSPAFEQLAHLSVRRVIHALRTLRLCPDHLPHAACALHADHLPQALHVVHALQASLVCQVLTEFCEVFLLTTYFSAIQFYNFMCYRTYR